MTAAAARCWRRPAAPVSRLSLPPDGRQGRRRRGGSRSPERSPRSELQDSTQNTLRVCLHSHPESRGLCTPARRWTAVEGGRRPADRCSEGPPVGRFQEGEKVVFAPGGIRGWKSESRNALTRGARGDSSVFADWGAHLASEEGGQRFCAR